MNLSFILIVAAASCISFAAYGNPRPDMPIKFDEFGSIPCAEERTRVDNYGKALQEQSSALAVVVVHAGRADTRKGEVLARLFGIRDRLRSASSIDQNRILLLDGGVREKLQVQLWIGPADARDAAKILVYSEIPSKDVRLKSPRLDKWEYECRGSR